VLVNRYKLVDKLAVSPYHRSPSVLIPQRQSDVIQFMLFVSSAVYRITASVLSVSRILTACRIF